VLSEGLPEEMRPQHESFQDQREPYRGLEKKKQGMSEGLLKELGPPLDSFQSQQKPHRGIEYKQQGLLCLRDFLMRWVHTTRFNTVFRK